MNTENLIFCEGNFRFSKKIRTQSGKYVLKDLTDKMVFIGGPRQVGKTTLARDSEAASGGVYSPIAAATLPR